MYGCFVCFDIGCSGYDWVLSLVEASSVLIVSFAHFLGSLMSSQASSESISLQSISLQSISLQSVPLQSVPLQSVPLQSVPLQSVPLQSISLEITTWGLVIPALLLGFLLTIGIGIGWMVLRLGSEKRYYGFLLVSMSMVGLQVGLTLIRLIIGSELSISDERLFFMLEIVKIIAGVLFLRALLNTRFIAKHFDLLLLMALLVYLVGSVIVMTPFATMLVKQSMLILNLFVVLLLSILWGFSLKEKVAVLQLNTLMFVAALGFIAFVPGASVIYLALRFFADEFWSRNILQILFAVDVLIVFLALLLQMEEQHSRLRAVALERSTVEQEAITEHRRNDALRRANAEILAQQELLEQQRKQIEAMNAALQENNRQVGEQNIQLKELHKEKDEFLGIVAHDLKNPLAGIASFANILQYDDGSLTPEQRVEFVGHIIESAERMFDIIRNLLEINMLERGGMRIQLQPIELSSMLDYAVGSYEERAAQKQITFQKDFTSPIVAMADEHLIMQVIDNLLSNAVKYSPHETNIRVRGYLLKDKIRLEFQDQGPGLTDEDHKKLFGKFARLSAQPTGGEHSTGLGLSIVKKMVEVMNSEVWCESEEGNGATFIVELPEASAEAGL